MTGKEQATAVEAQAKELRRQAQALTSKAYHWLCLARNHRNHLCTAKKPIGQFYTYSS